jgi:hypothetical protein
MLLKKIGDNMNEIILNNGDQILISYETPVACIKGHELYYTNKKWSQTTTKHINRWFQLKGWLMTQPIFEDQEFFNNLIKGV